MTKMIQESNNMADEVQYHQPVTMATTANLLATAMTTTTTTSPFTIAIPEASVATAFVDVNSTTALPITMAMTLPVTMPTSLPVTMARSLDVEGYIDPAIAQAAVSAVQTNSLTPLIKEELRYTIQAKRLQKGEEEIEVEYKPAETEELTPEEEERRRRRRERNKLAAQRCRNKRRTQADRLEEESQELEEHNAGLKQQVAALEREKMKLERMLRSHDVRCDVSPGVCGIRLSTSTCGDDEDNDNEQLLEIDVLDVMEQDDDQVVST